MTTQGIAVRTSTEALDSIRELEDRFAIAVRQRDLLATYIKDRLTPGKHFYQVGGSKNSLTKEGAELICLPHGYKPAYTVEGGPDQPPEDDTPYQITVRCTLHKGATFEGEGMGSASSHITLRQGERIPRQPDIGLRHNATLKMAQKSAYIAATLNATAASEFFTQDMEDGAEATGRNTEPKDNRFWCAEHNTEWFKKGRMSGYAHPIGDTKVWCAMKDARLDARDKRDWTEQDLAAAPEPDKGQDGTAMVTRSQVIEWAQANGFPTLPDMAAVPGVSDAMRARDFAKAHDLLEDAKVQLSGHPYQEP